MTPRTLPMSSEAASSGLRYSGLPQVGCAFAILTMILAGFIPATSLARVHDLALHGSDSNPTVASTNPGFSSGSKASLSATPQAICSVGVLSCPAGTDAVLARLNYSASGIGISAWPAVEILFVLETTPYDGVFDHTGINGSASDPCAGPYPSAHPLCDESNGVPFFVDNAGIVANELQSKYPSTKISFGLADYGASHDGWDDSDGTQHVRWNFTCSCFATYTVTGWDSGSSYVYHVDVGTFVSADRFESAVTSTFQRSVLDGGYILPGSDLNDNFLHSPSITALYGALSGTELGWSNDAHHVIVWIGSTAPRDPNYAVNYCMSDSGWAPYFLPGELLGLPICNTNSTMVTDPTCEPSYTFSTNVTMPACFGWVQSQDLSPEDSIATFARTSPACVESLGGSCTIDMVDLFATPTDAESLGWLATGAASGVPPNASYAGGWWAMTNAHRIVSAGCDLANATGGTWAGPDVANCGPNRIGSLGNVPYGTRYDRPFTSNPDLLSALVSIGLGSTPGAMIGVAAGTPMFAFVPFGDFQIDLRDPITTTCVSQVLPAVSCMTQPEVLSASGVVYLAWNWSSDPNLNALYSGDEWSASFYLHAMGPPFDTPVPIDACVSVACQSNGSRPIGGVYSRVAFTPAWTSGAPPSLLTLSFPPALVIVESSKGPWSPPSIPSPPPPPGPGLPLPSPTTNPVLIPQPIVTIASTIVGGFSVQAVAAGVLSAGFARIVLQKRAIAQRQAVGNVVRPQRSAFEQERPTDPNIGRFE